MTFGYLQAGSTMEVFLCKWLSLAKNLLCVVFFLMLCLVIFEILKRFLN